MITVQNPSIVTVFSRTISCTLEFCSGGRTKEDTDYLGTKANDVATIQKSGRWPMVKL